MTETAMRASKATITALFTVLLVFSVLISTVNAATTTTTMPTYGHLWVVVHYGNSGFVSGATVNAFNNATNVLVNSGLTAANGTVVLQLPAGNYLVKASAPGYGADPYSTFSVHVPPGNETQITQTLSLELPSETTTTTITPITIPVVYYPQPTQIACNKQVTVYTPYNASCGQWKVHFLGINPNPNAHLPSKEFICTTCPANLTVYYNGTIITNATMNSGSTARYVSHGSSFLLNVSQVVWYYFYASATNFTDIFWVNMTLNMPNTTATSTQTTTSIQTTQSTSIIKTIQSTTIATTVPTTIQQTSTMSSTATTTLPPSNQPSTGGSNITSSIIKTITDFFSNFFKWL